MDVWCVYVFILCLCCPVCRQWPCDGLITRPRSPTVCEKWLRNWIRGLDPEWAGRTIEKNIHISCMFTIQIMPSSHLKCLVSFCFSFVVCLCFVVACLFLK
jgi:hypothetical protein